MPDCYQGTELWDFSLVDPDNRRPVDYARRRKILGELQDRIAGAEDLRGLADELMETMPDGRIKTYLIYQTLNFCRERPEVFLQGSYLPLETTGAKRDHVCAFARSSGESTILVIVPRLVVGLVGGALRPPLGAEVWGKTRLLLPPHLDGQAYQNVFTGEVLAPENNQGGPGPLLGTVLGRFPVALLRSCPPPA